MGVRNSAKAIIIDGARVLVNRNENSLGDMCYGLPNGATYYDLPGGGQNQYETLEEAVKRECLEETGYAVTVERLAAIYEEISTNDEFREKYERYAHKIHFIFICRPINKTVEDITEKDLDMLESEWVNIESIADIPLYPQVIKTNIHLILNSTSLLFLGSERV